MKKLLLLFSVITLFACNKNDKEVKDNRIIYEIDKNHSDLILKTFTNYYKVLKSDEYNINKQAVKVRYGLGNDDYDYRFAFARN